MMLRRIEGATRVLGIPEGHDLPDLKIMGLPVRDMNVSGVHFMVSAWEPTPEELAALFNGASVLLFISADQHPVCGLQVSEPPL